MDSIVMDEFTVEMDSVLEQAANNIKEVSSIAKTTLADPVHQKNPENLEQTDQSQILDHMEVMDGLILDEYSNKTEAGVVSRTITVTSERLE